MHCSRNLVLSIVITILFIIPLLGCPADVSAEYITIGVPASLGTFAKEMPEAAELAAEEINTKGGISVGGKIYNIKIVTTDIRDLEPSIPIHDAILACEELISKEKPNALGGGPIRSEVLLSLMENIAKYKLITFFGGGVTDTFKTRVNEDYAKYKYFFRNSTSATDSGMVYAGTLDFIKNNFGYNKIFFLVEDVDFAKGIEKAVKGYCEKTGWEVGESVYTPLGMTDYSAPLLKLKNSGAEVGYYIYSSSAAPLAKQYQAMNIGVLMVGACTPLSGPDAWTATEGAVAYMVNSIPGAGNIPVSKMPKTVEFNNNFTQRYGPITTSLGCAQTYDEIYILANAFETAGSLDAEKLVPVIEETDYKGVLGRVRFDKATHQAIYGFDPNETSVEVVFQWIDGERVPVFPPSIAEAEVQLPK